ncbi:MAG: hypothetical protein ACRYFS_01100 [Janthinobacterium lividum]
MASIEKSLSSDINSPPNAPVPRQDWEEQFQRMAENGDDTLLDANVPSLTNWDDADWEW